MHNPTPTSNPKAAERAPGRLPKRRTPAWPLTGATPKSASACATANHCEHPTPYENVTSNINTKEYTNMYGKSKKSDDNSMSGYSQAMVITMNVCESQIMITLNFYMTSLYLIFCLFKSPKKNTSDYFVL